MDVLLKFSLIFKQFGIITLAKGFVRQEGAVDGLTAGNVLTKAIARDMSQLNIFSSEN